MASPDLEFFYDPSCPFCWVTSKWVRVVQRQTDLTVRWSPISLLTLNSPYEDPVMETWHMGGRQMHRVIAAAAEAHGDEVVGPLYEAIGSAIWETSSGEPSREEMAKLIGTKADLPAILGELDLPVALADAVDDDSRDHLFEISTKEALSRTGEGVGTPILTFDPDGAQPASFFGPVISEVPSDEDSVAFYRAIETAARIPSFSELKRTKRDMPQLPLLGS